MAVMRASKGRSNTDSPIAAIHLDIMGRETASQGVPPLFLRANTALNPCSSSFYLLIKVDLPWLNSIAVAEQRSE